MRGWIQVRPLRRRTTGVPWTFGRRGWGHFGRNLNTMVKPLHRNRILRLDHTSRKAVMKLLSWYAIDVEKRTVGDVTFFFIVSYVTFPCTRQDFCGNFSYLQYASGIRPTEATRHDGQARRRSQGLEHPCVRPEGIRSEITISISSIIINQ